MKTMTKLMFWCWIALTWSMYCNVQITILCSAIQIPYCPEYAIFMETHMNMKRMKNVENRSPFDLWKVFFKLKHLLYKRQELVFKKLYFSKGRYTLKWGVVFRVVLYSGQYGKCNCWMSKCVKVSGWPIKSKMEWLYFSRRH